MGIKKESLKIASQILRNRNIMVAVPVIIKNSKGEILLGKRNKKMPLYPSMWNLPGGIIYFKESLEEAAKREAKEEIGVEVKVLRYGKPWMYFPTEECPTQSLNIPTYCKIIKGSVKAEDETSEVKWFSPKKIKNMKLAYNQKKLLKQEGLI
jgi:8-oxo-dGTP diphosphatase